MKTFYLIPLFALLLLTGCKDSNYEAEEEIETITDPAQHILGQWKEIAHGNATFPELEPDGHTYRYIFTGINTLLLDYVDGAITNSMLTPTFHIYKRVEK
jgi:hypothetical protein